MPAVPQRYKPTKIVLVSKKLWKFKLRKLTTLILSAQSYILNYRLWSRHSLVRLPYIVTWFSVKLWQSTFLIYIIFNGLVIVYSIHACLVCSLLKHLSKFWLILSSRTYSIKFVLQSFSWNLRLCQNLRLLKYWALKAN